MTVLAGMIAPPRMEKSFEKSGFNRLRLLGPESVAESDGQPGI